MAGKWRCFPTFSDETPIYDVKYVHFIDEYAGSLWRVLPVKLMESNGQRGKWKNKPPEIIPSFRNVNFRQFTKRKYLQTKMHANGGFI